MTAPDPLGGLTVTTPWYPTLHNPVTGSFVTDWTKCASGLTKHARVVHAEEWPGGAPDVVAGIAPDADRVLRRMSARGELDTPGRWSALTRVPTIISSGFDVADRAEAAVRSVKDYVGTLETPVVHGHVGYLGGLTAARLAGGDSRVVVTEHSTGLGDFLSTARGRDIYTEVLERSHRLTCVSSVVRDLILDQCPGFDDTVVVAPNPVDFSPQRQRAELPQTLDRWVFAGGLIERKGVIRLVRAFVRFAAHRPEATLDLYGAGPLEAQIRDLAEEAGLADRVRLRGNVTHDELLAALTEHDVLIAPSRYETFHLVVPEAVAAGIPVVVTRSGGPQEALAGVAELVGRFIDVNDDPGELLEAVLDLESGLDAIDLPRARQVLSGRYGHAAVRSTLASLYGCADVALVPSTPPTSGAAPREHVIVSVSGWRKYAVAAFVDTLAAGNARTTLLTANEELIKLEEGVAAVGPADHLRAIAATPPDSVLGVVRTSLRQGRGPQRAARAAAKVLAREGRRRLGDLSRGSSTSAERQPEPEDPIGADPVYVVADVASFPTVAALLDARPEASLAIEPDRAALGLSAVDAP